MHIPDGILPLPVTAGALAATIGLTAAAITKIKRMPDPREGIPRAALFTAAFFILSTIHIPIPPTSVHLMLSGLLGVMLGYYAMPAVVIAIFLQAVMLGHGGLTTIGVNAIIIGLPALLCGWFYRWMRPTALRRGNRSHLGLAFAIGTFGSALAVVIFVMTILLFMPVYIDASAERAALLTLMLVHTPLVLVEGLFCAWLVHYFQRTNPELLCGSVAGNSVP
ncbi:cobalt transporter CbiM [Desulfurispira natronophila]|uniref:Cobalt/nickel transport system permease protein n=1 Tax=Desulfurispira natronophila TaxID=682562 RepID=A0A7W7Y5N5_9BACT|nr:cobalt transporter CbiM [Desulfurispira natronophila]MBB5022519.1 cobalt/nickel transport system permease protein [Desulfurispira natronophila]